MNENKKLNLIKEETQTVNEVQLKDLFITASKTETSIANLSAMAINFSNRTIKRKAKALRTMAFELVTEIQNAMDDTDEVEVSNRLDAPKPAEDMIGEAIFKIMKENKLTREQVLSITESYKFESENDENCKEEIKEENDMGAAEEIMEAMELIEGLDDSIDLDEAFDMTTDGNLDESKAEDFHEKIMEAINKPKFKSLYESVSKLKDTKNIDALLKTIYDYADKNSIVINY